ncbi:MAG: AEC family transporter, partial [Planctomycetes bacterium]|nr:AEC family transporter [Planctomycetota bacterium]
LIYGTLLPLTSILAMLGLGFLVRRLIRVPPGRRGIFTASFAFSNSIFIGLPVNMALFGEEALPYVLLYYFASTSLFWSVGNYLIASDGQTTPSPIVSLDTLKKIVSPPMLGFLSGLFLVLLGVKLPGVLANTARFMGGMTTPLVLLALGVMICDMGLSKIRFTRELFLVMVARFVVAPLLIILLTGLVPVDSLMRRVFIIQASLPVISSLALLAKFYNSDYDTATINVSATTMMSLVTVPVFMVIGSSI